MAVYGDMATAQFENMNALRSYPFAEGSSLIDTVGRELSQDVIVDAHIVVPSDVENPEEGIVPCEMPIVRVSSVHISPSMISVCFRSEFQGSLVAVSATVARDSFEPYRPVRLEKLAGSEDIGGIVTFGDLTFPGSPETYFLTSAIIHPGCIAVMRPSPVRKFVDRRSGDVISGDAQISFSNHVVTSYDNGEYTLSLADESAAELASECAQATEFDVCGATPIASINGIKPDDDGNIILWFH